MGIAEQIETALKEEGLSELAARGRIYTMDNRGLVTSGPFPGTV